MRSWRVVVSLGSSSAAQHWRTVSWFCLRQKFQIPTNPWDGTCSGPREVRIVLPFLHAFSGCSTVSSFAGCGKDRVGHLEDIQRRHPSLLHLSINPQLCWWSARCTGAPYSSSVWRCEQWREGEWGTEVYVLTEKQTSGWPSMHRLKLHLCNTQRELPTRQVVFGNRCS